MRVTNLHEGEKTTTNSISIDWSPIDTSPGNGGESLIDYKVYWTKNDGKSPWTVLTNSTKSQTKLET